MLACHAPPTHVSRNHSKVPLHSDGHEVNVGVKMESFHTEPHLNFERNPGVKSEKMFTAMNI